VTRNTLSISVVIPAYNAEAFLSRAIESVLAQTFPPSEIIVVDETTDSTAGVNASPSPAGGRRKP